MLKDINSRLKLVFPLSSCVAFLPHLFAAFLPHAPIFFRGYLVCTILEILANLIHVHQYQGSYYKRTLTSFFASRLFTLGGPMLLTKIFCRRRVKQI